MFNGSFEIVASDNPSLIILQDNSEGTDANLTGRTIYLYNADGSLFTPPIAWVIGDSSITLDVLSEDAALNIRVDWASSNPEPDPSTYTYSQIHAFTKYGKDYVYYLTEMQTSNPSITQDRSYYSNKLRLLCEILSAENAINVGHSIYGAAQCIARYTYMIQNPTFYF